MIRKLRNRHSEGFTLIELMIVIAIIGILAAIAIPNFISYRNKAFCNSAEADANQIEAFIADYYSVPENTAVLSGAGSEILGYVLNDKGEQNTGTLSMVDLDSTITIIVSDNSGRCPQEYRNPSNDWSSGTTTPATYTKLMSPTDYGG